MSEVLRWVFGGLTPGLEKTEEELSQTMGEQMGFNTQEALMAY